MPDTYLNLNMKKTEKLNKLFDEAEKSWKAVLPDSQGIRCPICWNEFSKSCIEDELVSIEDVPQKSWGSNWEVISCKKCNNTFGTKYQGRISGLKDIENIKAGRSKKKHRAKIVTDQGEFNAEVHTDRNGLIWMKGSKGINKPEIADYWLQLPNKNLSFNSVQVLLRQQFDPKVLSRVLLRDSYLLAFHYLGYPYICTTQIQEIRAILYQDKPIPDGAMLTLPFDPLENNTRNSRFFWVQTPQRLAGILVRWVVPELGNRFIVLPFFPYQWQSYHDLCRAWDDASKNQEKIELILVAMEFDKSARFSQRLKISKESNEIITLSGEH